MAPFAPRSFGDLRSLLFFGLLFLLLLSPLLLLLPPELGLSFGGRFPEGKMMLLFSSRRRSDCCCASHCRFFAPPLADVCLALLRLNAGSLRDT